MRFILAAASCLALAACGYAGQDNAASQTDGAASGTPQAADAGTMEMASNDAANADMGPADSEPRPIMQAQVILDRLGFTPGVVDGKEGMSTTNALKGYQEANGLTVTGQLDEATKAKLAQYQNIPATRVVTIPENWGSEAYLAMPEDPAELAKMKKLGYTSLDERLAERFHTTVETLKMLNPGGRPAGMPAAGASDAPAAATSAPSAAASASATPTASASASASGNATAAAQPGPASVFRPGQQIRVPNIGADKMAAGAAKDADWNRTLLSLGVGSEQPEVDRIVVSKAGKTLKAYQGEKLVALFTVSSGSSKFPLPLGEWKINGEAYNPPYSYDPEVLGKANSDGKTYQLPAGPNSPVGVVWIDLSKEHYGIHGTPDPETIGRAQSSGCVRLTNWDAARLAQMVSAKTRVIFEA